MRVNKARLYPDNVQNEPGSDQVAIIAASHVNTNKTLIFLGMAMRVNSPYMFSLMKRSDIFGLQ